MLTLLALLAASPIPDNAPEPTYLWPDGAPGALGETDDDRPHIRIYRPADLDGVANTGAACVVCPGGGYGALAMDHEGHQVAVWMQRLGITAAVLRYRLGPKYRHPAPLDDVTRAVRLLRSQADELGIDRDRLGVMGFSAGGHLASTIATHYDEGRADSDDPIERQPSRPSFSILGYPVISLGSDFAHGGSRRNLLGDDPDPATLASLTNETQVTAETPPTFLFHTADDASVPVKNAIVYYDALIENGVEAELHVFRHGRHGVGFAPGSPTLGVWPDLLANWLRDSGWLTPRRRIAISGTIDPPEAVPFGAIRFQADDPSLPVVYGRLRNGAFDIAEEHGPVPLHSTLGDAAGVYTVSIFDMGDVRRDPTVADVAELKMELDGQPVPRFLTVTPGGASKYRIVIGDGTAAASSPNDE